MVREVYGEDRAPVAIDKQLEVLAECGIFLCPHFAIDELLKHFKREAYERSPYRRLLSVMGSEYLGTDGRWQRLSDGIWHFDAECIYNDGDYVKIAERFQLLAAGDLPLEEVTDQVDSDGGEASLSFRLDGRSMYWPIERNDDWVDWTVFERFAALLARRDVGKQFICLPLAQDCLIGCKSPNGLRNLNAKTGLRFVWLSDV
jgi:hypothetical protein